MRRPQRALALSIASLVGTALALTLHATTAAATATRPPTVARDPCLAGQWRMSPAASTQLLRELVPVPGWLVTNGTITTSFRDGRMIYGSTLFILEGTLGAGQSIKAEASWINESSYRTRGGKIVTGLVSSEISYGDLTGTKDGETFSVPGPAGRSETLPGGATPYTCTRSTLKWPVPVGAGGSTMATFRRA
ncbi:MAG: hypothetical protein IPO93_14855 [Actinobacteria bacterium]|nr:hypothetical protein [Actinomycetota bacterium]